MSDGEAIVVRKRRRRTIDPSLGYYIANRLNSPKQNESHDTAVTIPSPGPLCRKNTRMRSPTCMITVNDFLQVQKVINNGAQKNNRNEEQNIRRDYLRLRSRTLIRAASPDPNSQLSQRSAKVPHGQRRSFKKRIYEAAVATCVDPIRTLAQPVDTPQSKPPLRFEPVNLSYARNAPATERKLRVVNPLKPSCFSGSRGHSEQRLPLTRWQVHLPLNRAQAEDRNLLEASCQLDGDEQAQLTAPSPLEFIPLYRAEPAYRAMFPPSFPQ